MTPILLTSVGVALLFGGGEFLVRGAVALANRIGISPLLVGMTVVAAGTSAPELVVSVSATLSGSPAIALGNVIGSNICNILLILGLSAVLKPIAVEPCEIRRDLKVLIAATLLLTALVVMGEVGRLAAIVLLGVQVAYVVLSYLAEKRRPTEATELYEHEAEELAGKPHPLWVQALFLGGGVVALVIGSRLLVSGASDIARSFGISEAVIGLTLVALGTSLPELATSAVAAYRGHSDVAVGNVVGSNIFNSLLIVGAAGLAAPLAVPANMAAFDVWVMLGVSVVTAVILWRGSVGRLFGGASLVAYAAYTIAAYVR